MNTAVKVINMTKSILNPDSEVQINDNHEISYNIVV